MLYYGPEAQGCCPVISIVMYITTEATVKRWILDNREKIHIYNAVRYRVSKKAHSHKTVHHKSIQNKRMLGVHSNQSEHRLLKLLAERF